MKQSDNPTLSGLSYPLLQVLDEVYLGADAELGGQDQRKIFMLSRDHIHKLGYRPSIHLMNPMIPSITSKISSPTDLEIESEQQIQPEQIDKYLEQVTKLKNKNITWDNFLKITDKIGLKLKEKNTKKQHSNKMSSIDTNSKIEFTENSDSIRKKISKAFAEPFNVSNTLFLFLQYVIFPINKLKSIEKFIIERDEKFGGKIEYLSLDEVKQDYQIDKLTPQGVKQGISTWLINFLEPVRNSFNDENIKELTQKAYPK